jgi:tetratricopeptide (TPR) repeat protein
VTAFQALAVRLRASAWLALGRPERALALFDALVRRCPGARHPLASRAHLRAQAGWLEGARADYERLLDSHPDDAQSWFNLGYVLDQQGRWSEALEAFRRATVLAPALDRAWYGLGLVLIRLRRLDEAAEALRRNTELQPMSPHGWYQLARVQLDRCQPDEARRIIGHLRGFEPRVAAQLARETGLGLEGGAT